MRKYHYSIAIMAYMQLERWQLCPYMPDVKDTDVKNRLLVLKEKRACDDFSRIVT